MTTKSLSKSSSSGSKSISTKAIRPHSSRSYSRSRSSKPSAVSKSAASSANANITTEATASDIADTSNPTPPRIVYGPGTISRLPQELSRLCLSSPLIITSPSRIKLARQMQALLPNLDARIVNSDSQSNPVDATATVGNLSGADVVISVGGASAVELARVISVQRDVPHICVPTTHRDSDGIRCGGRIGSEAKQEDAQRVPAALPTVIIYDEELTVRRPRRFSAPSGTSAFKQSKQYKELCRSGEKEASQWSFIQLPGV